MKCSSMLVEIFQHYKKLTFIGKLRQRKFTFANQRGRGEGVKLSFNSSRSKEFFLCKKKRLLRINEKIIHLWAFTAPMLYFCANRELVLFFTNNLDFGGRKRLRFKKWIRKFLKAKIASKNYIN